MPTTFRLSVLLVCLCGGSLLAEKQRETKQRRYDAGPLKREEFRGKVQGPSVADAATLTRVMIRYEFQTRVREGRGITELTAVEVYSVFLPQLSWWREAAGDELLDHEQGHFDIAEAAAQRVQYALERNLASKTPLIGEGIDPRNAEKDLANKIRHLMKTINQQAVEENIEYDRSTAHGLRRQTQAEWRRVQIATLQQLRKRLATLRKSARR